jgi:hypothetical protein
MIASQCWPAELVAGHGRQPPPCRHGLALALLQLSSFLLRSRTRTVNRRGYLHLVGFNHPLCFATRQLDERLLQHIGMQPVEERRGRYGVR